MTQLTQEHKLVILPLLRNQLRWLQSEIRENEALSKPCPPGRWRWADVNSSGYGHKSEDELAADRERADGLLVVLRVEVESVRSAIAALS
jgi:hypothetical protein